MKKMILILMTLVSTAYTMEKTAGALMLTAGYYALLEMSNEQSFSHPDWRKRDRLLMAGVTLNSAGLVTLVPQFIKSPTPVVTAGKYISGAFFLAASAALLTCAKRKNDRFKRMGGSLDPYERNKIIAQASLSAGLGLCLLGWAMNDIKDN